MAKETEQKLVRFDWAIKNILREKANFGVLEGFLTSLLNEEITVKEIIESEGNKKSFDEKNNRVDLKCKDSKGREIIIEIQSQYEFDYFQRILFGASKAVIERVGIGREYKHVPKIISISILYHDLEPEINKDYIYCGKTEMKGLHTGENLVVRREARQLPETCDIMPDYYFLCVGNFKRDRVKDKLDEWMYFFKTEAVKPNFKAPGIREAGEKLNYLAMSKGERADYDAYMDMLHYNQSPFRTAVETAEYKGRAEGESIGLEKGELKAKLETARKLLEMGLTHKQVSDGTGLPIEEVKKLAQ